jgi:hypothetical protein
MLHGALVRHPFSGVEVDSGGVVSLPIPDVPQREVRHWYLLTWEDERDGFLFAEELWQAVQDFVDNLLSYFERAVPKRFKIGN